MAWDDPLTERIIVGRRTLKTLEDAGKYISALPEKTQRQPQWKAATQALLLAKDHRAGIILATAAMRRGLAGITPGHKPPVEPSPNPNPVFRTYKKRDPWR